MADVIPWLPVLTILLGAAVAWWFRRHERLQDAYALWAAAIHHYVFLEVSSHRGDGSVEGVERAFAEILAAKAKVLLLEPQRNLRAIVILLSDMNELGPDAPERIHLDPRKGLWPKNVFFWRKTQRVDALVVDLATAGFFCRGDIELSEPTWKPLRNLNDVGRELERPTV